ncbi:MAG TPA: RodZ domain-containing protein [Burkholderiaceae bacterium]|nr:RodZ domain-containing protein [Burkholderiaceae bacterium]
MSNDTHAFDVDIDETAAAQRAGRDPRAFVGTTLAQQRQALGLSIEEVAARLKRPARQIDALERGSWATLPSGANLRGFVRTYAQALGLDPAPLVSGIGEVSPLGRDEFDVAPALAAPLPHADRVGFSFGRLGVLAVVLAVLSVALVMFADRFARNIPSPQQANVAPSTTGEQGATPLAVAPAIPPTVDAAANPSPSAGTPEVAASASVTQAAPAPTAPTVPPGMVQEGATAAAVTPPAAVAAPAVRLVFNKNSWFEVKRANGTVVANGLGEAGTQREWDVREPVTIVLGYAPGVVLESRGTRVDLGPRTRSDGVARVELAP